MRNALIAQTAIKCDEQVWVELLNGDCRMMNVVHFY